MRFTCSTREGVQYLLGIPVVPMRHFYEWQVNEISLTGTADFHEYFGMPHGYCTSSQVLQVCLMCTSRVLHRYYGVLHEYCTPIYRVDLLKASQQWKTDEIQSFEIQYRLFYCYFFCLITLKEPNFVFKLMTSPTPAMNVQLFS